jgi:hypothetical protein
VFAEYHAHGRDGNDGPSGGDLPRTYSLRLPGFVATPVDGSNGECFNRGRQGNIWKYQADFNAAWHDFDPVMLIPSVVIGCAPGKASVLGPQ